MNKWRVFGYASMLTWITFAALHIGLEMREQSLIWESVRVLNDPHASDQATEEATQRLAESGKDAILYLINELLQDEHRQHRMRLKVGIDKVLLLYQQQVTQRAIDGLLKDKKTDAGGKQAILRVLRDMARQDANDRVVAALVDKIATTPPGSPVELDRTEEKSLEAAIDVFKRKKLKRREIATLEEFAQEWAAKDAPAQKDLAAKLEALVTGAAPRKLLFAVEVSEPEPLNQGRVPEEILDGFEDNDLQPPRDAKVVTKTKDTSWSLGAAKGTYSIEKEAEKFSVYREGLGEHEQSALRLLVSELKTKGLLAEALAALCSEQEFAGGAADFDDELARLAHRLQADAEIARKILVFAEGGSASLSPDEKKRIEEISQGLKVQSSVGRKLCRLYEGYELTFTEAENASLASEAERLESQKAAAKWLKPSSFRAKARLNQEERLRLLQIADELKRREPIADRLADFPSATRAWLVTAEKEAAGQLVKTLGRRAELGRKLAVWAVGKRTRLGQDEERGLEVLRQRLESRGTLAAALRRLSSEEGSTPADELKPDLLELGRLLQLRADLAGGLDRVCQGQELELSLGEKDGFEDLVSQLRLKAAIPKKLELAAAGKVVRFVQEEREALNRLQEQLEAEAELVPVLEALLAGETGKLEVPAALKDSLKAVARRLESKAKLAESLQICLGEKTKELEEGKEKAEQTDPFDVDQRDELYRIARRKQKEYDRTRARVARALAKVTRHVYHEQRVTVPEVTACEIASLLRFASPPVKEGLYDTLLAIGTAQPNWTAEELAGMRAQPLASAVKWPAKQLRNDRVNPLMAVETPDMTKREKERILEEERRNARLGAIETLSRLALSEVADEPVIIRLAGFEPRAMPCKEIITQELERFQDDPDPEVKEKIIEALAKIEPSDK